MIFYILAIIRSQRINLIIRPFPIYLIYALAFFLLLFSTIQALLDAFETGFVLLSLSVFDHFKCI